MKSVAEYYSSCNSGGDVGINAIALQTDILSFLSWAFAFLYVSSVGLLCKD
jgi:hypothetical protein